MKYCYKFFLCVAVFCLPYTVVFGQGTKDPYQVVKSSNGQSFLLAPNADMGGTIYTDIYFRIGPAYEFDSASGISAVMSHVFSTHIETVLKANSDKKIKYYATVEPEQTSFHFESAAADAEFVFGLISDKIMHPKFDDESLDEAKTEVRAELDSLKGSNSYRLQSDLMRRVWGKDYKKLNMYSDQQNYAKLTTDQLKAFHYKYYLPFNNTVCVTGNFAEKEVLDKLLKAFADFKSKEFNPELINRVLEFKPIVNYIQMLSLTGESSLGTVTYQNPGARQDRSNTYCAFVLSQLINDKEGRIQKAMADSGVKNLKALYAPNNFYGTFTLSAEPKGDNFFDLFTKLNGLMTAITAKDYFNDEELDKAEKKIEQELKDFQNGNPKEFMNQVCRYRFSNDENYFRLLSDSINKVTVPGMRRYTDDYYVDHAGIKCLVTSAGAYRNAAPDQQYFPLDGSVEDVTFTYELNKSDIETDSAKMNFRRLIQWLRINPDMHVQINGFADEGEFSKAYDSTVMRFIDSTSTFRKAMPDRGKKNYFRIEMMRAIKIAKALYEAGISEDRITGTSMVFTSDSKEAAAANRKCTITLEKIKPHISLYEYHFGKKKEETPASSPR